MLGVPVSSIRHDGGQWIVNDTFTAPVLVGAGGHFCRVAQWLNGPIGPGDGAPLVVAQEVEFAVDPRSAGSCTTAPEAPELYFCRDLNGYGWCFHKQDYVNVGLGRLDGHSLPKATAEFVAFLETRRKISVPPAVRWRGHAYLLNHATTRRLVDAGVMLVGDAAGLAYPQSGEGIRPAIESGLLAAATIVEAEGRYTRDRLQPYEARLRARFGAETFSRAVTRLLQPRLWAPLAGGLIGMPAFVRHVVLDRWFLHTRVPALALP
jgi:flavin-dependent dehydrogenase